CAISRTHCLWSIVVCQLLLRAILRRMPYTGPMSRRIPSQPDLQAELLSGQVRLLRAMSEVTGLEPSNLARAARLAPSTVNRVLSGGQQSVISTVSVAALARVVEGRLAELGDPAPLRQRWDAAQKAWNGLAFLEPALSGVEVVGYVEAGAWQSTPEWPL